MMETRKGAILLRQVNVDNLTFGQGAPKIIVPMVGKTKAELLNEAAAIKASTGDLAEWRIDFFEEVGQLEQVASFSKELKAALGKPLLITFRNQNEGGNLGISAEKYTRIYQTIAEKGAADLLDVEVSLPERTIENVMAAAREHEIKVIMSSHDFKKTPEKMELFALFMKMQEHGADLCKVAVTPQTSSDLLTLFTATKEMADHYAKCPVITLAMGDLGKITRIAGQLFGSAATFATVGEASAAGQMPAEQVRELLTILSLEEKK